MTNKCNSCKYRATWPGAGQDYYCAYILAEHRRRPCSTDKCTVYKKGRKPFSDEFSPVTVSKRMLEKKRREKIERLNRGDRKDPQKVSAAKREAKTDRL